MDPMEASTAPASAMRGTDADLSDVFAILRKRIAVVAIPVVLALVLAGSYLAVAPRTYTGVTSILIDARTRPAVGDVTTQPTSSPDAVLVESQVRLISSEPVLRRVVIDEDLADDPEFAPTRPGLRSRLLIALGLGSPPSVEDRVTKALLNLAPRVVIKRSERTYIADIEVTSGDADKAARLANAVARAYLADQQAARSASAARDSDWVREQISTMQAGLQDAERRAEAFRREHGIIGANGKLLNEQDLGEAATALADGRAKATEIKARFDQIQRIIAAGRNLDALPDALRSPTIEKLRGQLADLSRQEASLRQTLGDRHPALLESEQQLRDVRRSIADELKRVQAGLANESQTAQANVAGLDKHVQDLKQVTVLSNESRLRLDELQRDVEARRAVYDRFLRARDTVREQTVDAPIGRIIAPALAPVAPSSPKSFAILALSLAGGLAIGVGLALLCDLFLAERMLRWPSLPVRRFTLPKLPRVRPFQMRPRPKRSAEPRAPATGSPALPVVPLLGAVPSPFGTSARTTFHGGLIDRLRAAWPTTIDIDPEPPHSAFLQAIAQVGQSLGIASSGEDGACRILVATSVSGFASRTTVALGLAQAAAAAGGRALVIDADGKSSLLNGLVVPGAQPALIDLMGTNRLCYRIRSRDPGSLSIVPVTADEAKMALRLESRPDTARIDGISGNFDLVIFDGPTIGRMARLNTIAASADTVILVAPPEATRTDLDRAVALFDLPSTCAIVAVVAEEFGDADAGSVAA